LDRVSQKQAFEIRETGFIGLLLFLSPNQQRQSAQWQCLAFINYAYDKISSNKFFS